VGQITIYTPFSLNTPPFEFFLSIYFRNIAELYGLHNDTYFPSKMLQNSTDYATMLVFYFRNVAKLYGLRNNACVDFRNVAKLYGLCNNACFKGSKGSKQGSKADRKYPRMKLGYDITQGQSHTVLGEANMMAEEPRRVTLEDYSSSSVPQFFTSIVWPEVQAQNITYPHSLIQLI